MDSGHHDKAGKAMTGFASFFIYNRSAIDILGLEIRMIENIIFPKKN